MNKFFYTDSWKTGDKGDYYPIRKVAVYKIEIEIYYKGEQKKYYARHNDVIMIIKENSLYSRPGRKGLALVADINDVRRNLHPA